MMEREGACTMVVSGASFLPSRDQFVELSVFSSVVLFITL